MKSAFKVGPGRAKSTPFPWAIFFTEFLILTAVFALAVFAMAWERSALPVYLLIVPWMVMSGFGAYHDGSAEYRGTMANFVYGTICSVGLLGYAVVLDGLKGWALIDLPLLALRDKADRTLLMLAEEQGADDVAKPLRLGLLAQIERHTTCISCGYGLGLDLYNLYNFRAYAYEALGEFDQAAADREIADSPAKQLAAITGTLFVAASTGDIERAASLIQHTDVDVAMQDKQGRTALMHAVLGGHTELIRDTCRLDSEFPSANYAELATFATPNVLCVQDKAGKTVLQLAEDAGHEEIAEAIRAGADAVIRRMTTRIVDNVMQHNTHIPLLRRAECYEALGEVELAAKDRSLIAWFQASGDGARVARVLSLFEAATVGDALQVKKMVTTPDVLPNEKNPDGETALMKAAAEGQERTAIVLWLRGANEQERDKLGQTPLMHAVEAGHTKLLKTIAEKGTNPVHQGGIGPFSYPSRFFYDSTNGPAGERVIGDLTVLQYLEKHGMAETVAILRKRIQRLIAVCSKAIEDPENPEYVPLALQKRARFWRELGESDKATADEQAAAKLKSPGDE